MKQSDMNRHIMGQRVSKVVYVRVYNVGNYMKRQSMSSSFDFFFFLFFFSTFSQKNVLGLTGYSLYLCENYELSYPTNSSMLSCVRQKKIQLPAFYRITIECCHTELRLCVQLCKSASVSVCVLYACVFPLRLPSP